MPEKEGAEEKSTKSVVNKKQKQMMGEEGYDHLRDMGRIRKNKDKKDATTMPPSKEMEKTRKVNKGPSALEVVKKKYKGQIMKMEELDLTKVAESFGGYIVEAPSQNMKDAKAAADALSDMKTDKVMGKVTPSVKKGVKKTIRKVTAPKPGERQSAKQIVKKFLDKPDPEADSVTFKASTDKKAASDVGRDALLDKINKPAMSGSKQKGSVKGPSLSPTTSGRKITKKLRPTKTKFQQDIEKIRTSGGKKITTGEIGYNAPKRPEKITKRVDRAGGDVFKIDTSRAAQDVAKDFGSKPVKGGLDFGKPGTGIKDFKFQPRDRSTQKAAEKTKQSFSDFSKKLTKQGADIDIEKRVANPKTASTVVSTTKSKGRGAVSGRAVDFSNVSRKTGKMKSGTKVVKQLGRTPKLGGSVVKVIGKETGEAAAKTAAKKALQKGAAKGLAKQIPGVGSVLAGAEAGYRALKGDFKGAALSAAEAIPGLGLAATAANVARDVSKAKKAAKVVKTVSKAKRAKDAVKVVTPTVVGSTADKIAQAKKGISNFAKTPTGAATVIGGGALTGKGIEKNLDPRKLRPPTIKGGRTGRRSAKS